MSVTSSQVLKLYKDLLRYGQQLKYTEKSYFNKRIRNEFRKNQNLEDTAEINLNYERGLTILIRRSVV
ncbi:hypothetical protein HHI36_009176 [Cryptolaemus montrouzieri]|uniref:Complex 1 LYR protein domain-containing protein n=1 Tax=Cryptolaemus montrouzieri TaxID=559131 RepID=A0ABD2MV39_9CUCU